MKKLPRYLNSPLKLLTLDRHKMAFISGPRQVGKTTFAKGLLPSGLTSKSYYSWDDLDFKKNWSQSPTQLVTSILEKDECTLVVFDELHKNVKWKNQLKGVYDLFSEQLQIIVTGSANFNTYRKGADSLLGRFNHYHLHPFSLREVLAIQPPTLEEFLIFVENPGLDEATPQAHEASKNLFQFGGFPEPLFAQSQQLQKIWMKNRIELLVRQDVRDLSPLLQNNQIELLSLMLPEKVSSTLSIQSLREDLDVAHTSVSRWLSALEQVYFHFELKPYTKSVVRSLKKEPKIYMYDWSMVESEGPRFENMIASHLLKLCDYFTDTGQGSLKLFYLRNKEKVEVDFLLLLDGKPLLTIEAKLSDTKLDPGYVKYQKLLKIPHFQIINSKNYFKKHFYSAKDHPVYVMSFDRFFKQGV